MFTVRSNRDGTKYAQLCNSNSRHQNAFFRLILLKSCNQNDVIIKMANRWNENRNLHYFRDILDKRITKYGRFQLQKWTYLVPFSIGMDYRVMMGISTWIFLKFSTPGGGRVGLTIENVELLQLRALEEYMKFIFSQVCF